MSESLKRDFRKLIFTSVSKYFHIKFYELYLRVIKMKYKLNIFNRE